MITIKEARTKNSGNRSQNFRLNYIKNNPYFVPPLYSEEIICPKIITAITTRKAAYFLAYKDGVLWGRISAIMKTAAAYTLKRLVISG